MISGREIFRKINYFYRSLLSLLTGTEFRPNILHPQFLIQIYMKRNLKKTSLFAKGLMLDLGCGTKPYYEIFNKKTDAYYGLDALNHREPDYFTDRNAHSPDILGDVVNLPIKSGCVDAILCTQVIEHLSQPDSALKECYRTLKNGAYIFLTCPQAYPIHDKENDYFRFTALGIKYLLEKNGLKVEKIMRHGGFFIEQALLFNIYINYNLFREGEGLSLTRVILVVGKIFLTPVLLLGNALMNILALGLNFFDRDENFTHNYTVIALKYKCAESAEL